MDNRVEKIKGMIDGLDKSEQMRLLSWTRFKIKESRHDMQEEIGRIWNFMSASIKSHDRDIDIKEEDSRRKVVLFRSLVFYHLYTDWVPGSSYMLIGRCTGYSHDNVGYCVRHMRDALSANRNIRIFAEPFEVNDIVETMYNNYIKQ